MRTDQQQSRTAGFSLIEMLTILAVVAIIAAIAIPNLRSARLSANESTAISTLRNISLAQAQCRASAAIDANNNGTGEYGFFGELAGESAVRNDEAGGVGTVMIAPSILSAAFGNVAASRIVRSGYVFQVFLPDTSGVGLAENATGGSSGVSIDASRAEVMWCCYAWPSAYGNSGKRAFFVNQEGDVLSCHNDTTRYSGALTPPNANAAFRASTSGHLDNAVAANTAGIDTNVWVVVN